jgi:hypothetical protein
MSAVFSADVSEADSGMKAIEDAMEEAMSLDVLVGVPDDAGSRSDDGSAAPTNAELLYIHTNGSEINELPARPAIEPALEKNKEQVSQLLQKIADAAVSGDVDRVRAAAEKAGQQGASIARKWFTDPANGWAEIKKGTIKSRKRRMSEKGREKAAALVEAAGNTLPAFKPLIDTTQLRKSITYVVRKK